MSQDILSEFMVDACDHIERANEHLLALQKNPGQTDHLNGLLRVLHTVKGNAGFLELKQIFELIHKAENTLQSLRQAGITPFGDIIDLFFNVLDSLELMVEELAKDAVPVFQVFEDRDQAVNDMQ